MTNVFINSHLKMSRDDMLGYLNHLSDILKRRRINGEIVLYGGAAMVLAFEARPSTKDIDAVFKPKMAVYNAAKKVSELYGAPEGWLNDAIKGFISSEEDLRLLMELSNLKIYHASPEYLLAMKCMSMRLGTDETDLNDIKFLMRRLSLLSPDEVFSIVEAYYPRRKIPSRTMFAIEELFDRE